MINSKQFHSLLPAKCYEICTSISRQGFCLTLVGGAVRDYLMTGELSRDLDFEIKHLFSYKQERWERMLIRLFQSLSVEYDLSFKNKGMNVFSIEVEGFSLEFSSPRLELFDEDLSGHKNFSPTYVSNLDYVSAYKRRDFSINALGIFFGVVGSEDEFTLVDCFNGLEDLRKKKLKNIDDDFFLDPVRFLRLIRFKHKLNFSIDKGLLGKLNHFNLEKVTHFYVLNEFLKSRSLLFFKDLFEISNRYEIKLEENLAQLSFLKDLCVSGSSIRMDLDFTLAQFIKWCVFHKDLNDSQKKKVVIYFGFSHKKLKRYLLEYKESFS